MEKYLVILTEEELICLEHALSIAYLKLNYSAEHARKWGSSIMSDAYKKEAIETEKLLDKLNDIK